ncbi:MAG: hypothetical protein R2748_17505 [Bryobacterales bacterium]
MVPNSDQHRRDKYFHGRLGTPERETSLKQLVGRVCNTIAAWGERGGYFADKSDAENFRLELTHLMINQMASFNSPVWFNVGVEETRGYGWTGTRRRARSPRSPRPPHAAIARPASSTRSTTRSSRS